MFRETDVNLLFHAHSGFRYVVLATGVVVLLYVLFALASRRPPGRVLRVLLAVFNGALDLQLTLGLILVFLWPFYPALIGHIVSMLAAVAAAHVLSARTKRVLDQPGGTLWGLLAVVVPLALIVVGILAIGRPLV